MKQYKVCLTIAGSDPSGGAGIQADIKTMTLLGCYAQAVPTCLTVQNTLGVQRSIPIDAELVFDQAAVTMEDCMPQCVKIGIVPNLAIAHAITELLRKFKPKFCIFDPVLISSSGLSFVDNETCEFMFEELMPLCQLITPNLPEAHHLAQMGDATADELAQYLYNKLKGTPVMVKGGHLPGSPTDYLFDGALHKFQSERLNSHNTHGTGCVLSSAIASYKAQGMELKDAIAQAKQFLFNAIKQGANYKHGNGCGPLYLVP